MIGKTVIITPTTVYVLFMGSWYIKSKENWQ